MEEAGSSDKANLWRRRIEAQRLSGQSVRAWCLANDAPEHSFFWWRDRLGLSPQRRRIRRASKPLAFARVVVGPAAAEERVATTEQKAGAAEGPCLRLAGGRELLFPASMPLKQVAELVKAIEDGGDACRDRA